MIIKQWNIRVNNYICSCALLFDNVQEQKIDISTEGYGIILGNTKGNTHIIKVCNPYCGHCADAQVILQNMIEFNKDIKLQNLLAELI